MNYSFSKSLAAAAATGLLAAACGGTSADAKNPDDAPMAEKEGCGAGMDKESCKAEEGCDAKHECKAQAECQGKDSCKGHSPE